MVNTDHVARSKAMFDLIMFVTTLLGPLVVMLGICIGQMVRDIRNTK